MADLDQEDLDFLQEIANELRRFENNVYGAEADELENIIYRAKEE